MKPLIYHRNQWLPVWEQIKRDHLASVYLIRTNMRQTLGFSAVM